jgi:hypothetical protein
MGSMKGKQAKIDAAFGRLADMINGGNLLASADPVGFLDTIATELKDLRAENVKIRGLMSIEADKHNERQIMLQDTMEQLEELKASVIGSLILLPSDNYGKRLLEHVLGLDASAGYSEGQTVRVIAPDLRETGVAGKITGIPGDGYICVELGSGPPWRGRYLPHEIKAL